MSEVVPTRDQIAGVLADLDIDNTLLSPEAKVLISTATIDTAFLRGALRLALSALDAQEAAGEGVTECLIEAGIDVAGDATRDQVIDIIEAVHPAIFSAGERAGLEKAAALAERAKLDHGPGEMGEPYEDLASLVAAIRSLKGGTP